MNRLDDIRHGLDADADYDDEDTIPISIGDVRWLAGQVADLLAALEDALWRWNGLTQERRDEIAALAPDPLAAALEEEV